MANEEGQGGGGVAHLEGAGQMEGLGEGSGVDFNDFGGFVVGRTQGDSGGQKDMADFAGDAVGGVEVVDGDQFLGDAADFFA